MHEVSAAKPVRKPEPSCGEVAGLHNVCPRWEGGSVSKSLSHGVRRGGVLQAVYVLKRPSRVDDQVAATVQEGIIPQDLWKGVLHGHCSGGSLCCKGVALGLEEGWQMSPSSIVGRRDICLLHGALGCGGCKCQANEVDQRGRGGMSTISTQRGGQVVCDAPLPLFRGDADFNGELDRCKFARPLCHVGGALVAEDAGTGGRQGASVISNNGTPSEAMSACHNEECKMTVGEVSQEGGK